MATLLVNTASKARKLSKASGYIAIGSYCDIGTVYKVVEFNKTRVVFCK